MFFYQHKHSKNFLVTIFLQGSILFLMLSLGARSMTTKSLLLAQESKQGQQLQEQQELLQAERAQVQHEKSLSQASLSQKTTDRRENSVSGVKSLLDQSIAQGDGLPVFGMMFMVFLAGVLTSFTPCIYPMIPITIGILQSQAGSSLFYNFLSSMAYVLGISFVYAGLGYLAATTNVVFGQWLGNPFFILFVILFFLYFAFALFGFYEIYIPAFLRNRSALSQDKLGKQYTLLHTFFYGMISGTVASPCLTPALALVLGLAAKTANPILGFLYLLSFSLGMSMLLVLVGTFSSTLALLPQAGEWMDDIKKVFGFVILAVCVHFLEVFIPRGIALELYSLVVFIASIYYFVSARSSKGKIILGILLLTLSAALLGFAIKLSLSVL